MASTIFIIDDDYGFRHALLRLLEATGLKAKAYGSASEFIEAYTPVEYGCLILDIGLPGMDGLMLQSLLMARHILLPTIILTGMADVSRVVKAMKAGAFDVLEKPVDPSIMLERVHMALAQSVEIRENQQCEPEIANCNELLSLREQEVLTLVALGLTSKEIARQLKISYRTVEGHRQSIRHKTGAESIPELVDIARACGLNH